MGKRRNPPKSPVLPSLKSQQSANVRDKPKISMKKLYTIPDSFSATVIPGEDAPTQLFHGYSDNPRENLPNRLWEQPWELQDAGPQVLLNIDLGSNAYNDKDHKETIPAWIPPDYIEHLNETIGPAPDVGVEEAARLGIKWGKIEALPDLGGVRGDGDGVLWEQKEILGKGNGVIALKDFDTGDLIIGERPVMLSRLRYRPMPDMSRPGCYKALYERLSPSQQLRFRSLYNAKKIVSFVPLMQLGDVTEGIDEGIARTNIINCHPLGEDVTYPFGGVFAHTSRVNHSCSPNVMWIFIQRNFSLEVRAVRPIKQGEELVASYGPDYEQWRERQSYLLEKYQFTCRCQCCSLEGREREESDKRRARLGAWDQTHPSVDDWYRNPAAFGKDALVKHYEERLPIMYQEGLHALTPSLLYDLLQAHVTVGDAEKAYRIGKGVMMAMAAIVGDKGGEQDQTKMENIKQMMTRPTTHRLWRLAEKRVQDLDGDAEARTQQRMRPVQLCVLQPGQLDLEALKQQILAMYENLSRSSV